LGEHATLGRHEAGCDSFADKKGRKNKGRWGGGYEKGRVYYNRRWLPWEEQKGGLLTGGTLGSTVPRTQPSRDGRGEKKKPGKRRVTCSRGRKFKKGYLKGSVPVRPNLKKWGESTGGKKNG